MHTLSSIKTNKTKANKIAANDKNDIMLSNFISLATDPPTFNYFK